MLLLLRAVPHINSTTNYTRITRSDYDFTSTHFALHTDTDYTTTRAAQPTIVISAAASCKQQMQFRPASAFHTVHMARPKSLAATLSPASLLTPGNNRLRCEPLLQQSCSMLHASIALTQKLKQYLKQSRFKTTSMFTVRTAATL